MAGTLFGSIIQDGQFTMGGFIAATICSLVLGMIIAFVFKQRKGFSQSYLITLALIPAAVQLIIMLVNGNIGAGIAAAGAFSLVRYRSAPGSGQEITGIFIAMAVGLATGMGYLAIAALFSILLSAIFLILSKSGFGGNGSRERVLRITIPESLDFDGVFDDVLDKYTNSAVLDEVRTTNMGSLYKLSYSIDLRQDISVKDMIDELRVRNGNLEISCGRPLITGDEL